MQQERIKPVREGQRDRCRAQIQEPGHLFYHRAFIWWENDYIWD